jgi:MoxR-like ATPase
MNVLITEKGKNITQSGEEATGCQKDNFSHKIQKLLAQVGAGLHEREQVLAICLLGAISGQNTFLYGPPGTAKSLISRRLACAFKDPHYFEYLMNRFSTPEEVFGPVSIKALREDKYTRKIEGYLPTADFAFLDEIWKSSPAILNTLLTLINEHVFKNGDDIVDVPLKTLIAASNEVPAENQGLDALYDRFILRLLVPPIEREDNFNALLRAKPSSSKPDVDVKLTIDYQELANWQQQIHQVQLSEESILVIKYIRIELAEKHKELGVYVSDRRWQRAAMLLKASALCNGRDQTNHSDAILLKHCLWTSPENQQAVSCIVMQAIEDLGVVSETDIAALDKEKDSLDKEISRELFYSIDIYDTVTLPDGKDYFKAEVTFSSGSYNDNKKTLFIPYAEFKSIRTFCPSDENGNALTKYQGQFDKQGTCKLSYPAGPYHGDTSYTPSVLFHKGDKKREVNTRLIESLAGSVSNLRGRLKIVLTDTDQKLEKYKAELCSPFVTEQETNIAVHGIIDQIDQLKLRIKDCERLEALCK